MQFVSSHCDYWMKEGKDGMDVDGVLQAPSTNGIRMNDDEEGGNDDEHLYYYTITIGNRMSRIQPLSTTLRSTLQSLRSTNISRPKNNVRSHLQSRFSSSYNSRQESLRSQILRPTTIVLILVPIFTFGLGWWQIQRLRWKVGLIEEVERNMKKEPMVLPAHIK
jgi:hypothetical protein